MAKIGVATQQGMISRIIGMMKEILVDNTNEEEVSVLAEVEDIKKQENAGRVKFLMDMNSEGQASPKQTNPVQKVKTKQVKIEENSKNKSEGRELGD